MTIRFRVDSDLEGSYDQARPESAAWGEEIADSVETASMLVEALAAEFSIPQARIKIEIRMNNMTNGTRH